MAKSELSFPAPHEQLKNPAHPFQEYPLGPVLKFEQKKPFLSFEEGFFIFMTLSPYRKLGKPPHLFLEHFFKPAFEFLEAKNF